MSTAAQQQAALLAMLHWLATAEAPWQNLSNHIPGHHMPWFT